MKLLLRAGEEIAVTGPLHQRLTVSQLIMILSTGARERRQPVFHLTWRHYTCWPKTASQQPAPATALSATYQNGGNPVELRRQALGQI